MIVYIFIIILLLILLKNINSNKMSFFDLILLIILVCICGLRNNVGSDYSLYVKMYNNLSLFPRTEFIFVQLISLLNKMNFNSQFFFFVVAFLTLYLFYISLKKNSTSPSQSIFYFITLGYYAMCFNGIRQMLAAAVCLLATKYIINRDTKKVLLLIVLASLCHSTALIMIPAYFISNCKFSKKQYFVIFILSLSAFVFYEPVLNFITNNFEQYSVYANQNSMTYWEPGPGTYIIAIFHFVLQILCITKIDKLEQISKDNRVYLNLFILSTMFFSLSFMNALTVRIAYYFSIYLVFLLPNLLRVFWGQKNDKKYMLVVIFFTLYYIVHLISFNQMLPYNSILG